MKWWTTVARRKYAHGYLLGNLYTSFRDGFLHVSLYSHWPQDALQLPFCGTATYWCADCKSGATTVNRIFNEVLLFNSLVCELWCLLVRAKGKRDLYHNSPNPQAIYMHVPCTVSQQDCWSKLVMDTCTESKIHVYRIWLTYHMSPCNCENG